MIPYTYGDAHLYPWTKRCGKWRIRHAGALAAALVFLDLNGFELSCTEDEAYGIMMRVASGDASKNVLTDFFKERAAPIA